MAAESCRLEKRKGVYREQRITYLEHLMRLGADGIEIVETSFCPGEKLYEELLVKNEELEKQIMICFSLSVRTPLVWIKLRRSCEC